MLSPILLFTLCGYLWLFPWHHQPQAEQSKCTLEKEYSHLVLLLFLHLVLFFLCIEMFLSLFMMFSLLSINFRILHLWSSCIQFIQEAILHLSLLFGNFQKGIDIFKKQLSHPDLPFFFSTQNKIDWSSCIHLHLHFCSSFRDHFVRFLLSTFHWARLINNACSLSVHNHFSNFVWANSVTSCPRCPQDTKRTCRKTTTTTTTINEKYQKWWWWSFRSTHARVMMVGLLVWLILLFFLSSFFRFVFNNTHFIFFSLLIQTKKSNYSSPFSAKTYSFGILNSPDRSIFNGIRPHNGILIHL